MTCSAGPPSRRQTCACKYGDAIFVQEVHWWRDNVFVRLPVEARVHTGCAWSWSKALLGLRSGPVAWNTRNEAVHVHLSIRQSRIRACGGALVDKWCLWQGTSTTSCLLDSDDTCNMSWRHFIHRKAQLKLTLSNLLWQPYRWKDAIPQCMFVPLPECWMTTHPTWSRRSCSHALLEPCSSVSRRSWFFSWSAFRSAQRTVEHITSVAQFQEVGKVIPCGSGNSARPLL